MVKQKITITENELKHIINECVNSIVNENFVDTMQGAWNGAKMGNNKMQAQNEIEDAKMWCQYGKRMCQDIPKIYR